MKIDEVFKEYDVVGIMLSGILIFGTIRFSELYGEKYFMLTQNNREVFHNKVRCNLFFVGKESNLIYPK